MDIVKATSTKHTSLAKNREIKYIVLHYTAGTASNKGKALAVANGFSTSTRDASADYIVDDGMVVQYNADIRNRYCWSVGGTKYKNINTSIGGRFYKQCTNKNSISIEMCSNKNNTKSLLASDTDWFISSATRTNAIELVRLLMQEYNIPIENVIMHHEVTGKVCPNPWCVNESRLEDWYLFKHDVTHSENAPQPQIPTSTTYKVKVIVDSLNVRNEPSILGAKQTTIKMGEIYTIVDEQKGWGLLKAYAGKRNGWINLSDKYVKRV